VEDANRFVSCIPLTGRGMDNTAPMTPTNRRLLAILSACAIAACIIAYVYSFFGASVDKVLPWVVLLFVGWVALFIPIYAIEYPASRSFSFAWTGFVRGMPGWVALCTKALLLNVIAHLLWSAALYGPGVPAIVDGQYVLDDHGRILKVLTQAEYFAHRGAALRMIATWMIYVYFLSMVYWWFRRYDKPVDWE
jgi:hypothetical protein